MCHCVGWLALLTRVRRATIPKLSAVSGAYTCAFGLDVDRAAVAGRAAVNPSSTHTPECRVTRGHRPCADLLITPPHVAPACPFHRNRNGKKTKGRQPPSAVVSPRPSEDLRRGSVAIKYAWLVRGPAGPTQGILQRTVHAAGAVAWTPHLGARVSGSVKAVSGDLTRPHLQMDEFHEFSSRPARRIASRSRRCWG
jgi:hypothetical protein